MTHVPVFRGRTSAGERLYDLLQWLRAPRVHALSLGGLEVACPIAYLGRGSLGTVVGPPGSRARRTDGPVLLVDDGCTPAPELLAAADELAREDAPALVVAAPWLPSEARVGLRARRMRAVTLLTGRIAPEALYPPGDPPSPERVARFLEAGALLPSRPVGVRAAEAR